MDRGKELAYRLWNQETPPTWPELNEAAAALMALTTDWHMIAVELAVRLAYFGDDSRTLERFREAQRVWIAANPGHSGDFEEATQRGLNGD